MFSYTKQFTVPEQFKTVFPDQLQHQFQQQVSLLQSLGGKAIEGAEKLLELNLHLGHDSIEHSRAVAQKLFTAKSAQEFFSHSSELFKPNLEQWLNYGRKLIHIATESQAQVLQAATQKTEKSEKEFVKPVVAVEKKAEHLVDEVHHNARATVEVATANKQVSSKKDSQVAPEKAVKKVQQEQAAKATTKTGASKTSNFPPQLPTAPQVKPVKPAAKPAQPPVPALASKAVAATPVESKPAVAATAIEPVASTTTPNPANHTPVANAVTSNTLATEINTIE